MHAYEVTEALPAISAALKAAGEPSRLRILKALEDGELCVCHLVEMLGLAQPTVSRHVAALRAAGLVGERREGRWSYFRLEPAAPFLGRILDAIRSSGSEDPVFAEDRARAAEYREVPVDEFCTAVRRKCR
jgi:arsenate reductase/ArsR family transcriptional regulator